MNDLSLFCIYMLPFHKKILHFEQLIAKGDMLWETALCESEVALVTAKVMSQI
jgi:hypothetical protein